MPLQKSLLSMSLGASDEIGHILQQTAYTWLWNRVSNWLIFKKQQDYYGFHRLWPEPNIQLLLKCLWPVLSTFIFLVLTLLANPEYVRTNLSKQVLASNFSHGCKTQGNMPVFNLLGIHFFFSPLQKIQMI